MVPTNSNDSTVYLHVILLLFFTLLYYTWAEKWMLTIYMHMIIVRFKQEKQQQNIHVQYFHFSSYTKIFFLFIHKTNINRHLRWENRFELGRCRFCKFLKISKCSVFLILIYSHNHSCQPRVIIHYSPLQTRSALSPTSEDGSQSDLFLLRSHSRCVFLGHLSLTGDTISTTDHLS